MLYLEASYKLGPRKNLLTSPLHLMPNLKSCGYPSFNKIFRSHTCLARLLLAYDCLQPYIHTPTFTQRGAANTFYISSCLNPRT